MSGRPTAMEIDALNREETEEAAARALRHIRNHAPGLSLLDKAALTHIALKLETFAREGSCSGVSG